MLANIDKKNGIFSHSINTNNNLLENSLATISDFFVFVPLFIYFCLKYLKCFDLMTLEV